MSSLLYLKRQITNESTEWTGPVVCAFAFICVVQSPYVSQCIPDPSVSTTAKTTSSRTTASIPPKETYNYLFAL